MRAGAKFNGLDCDGPPINRADGKIMLAETVDLRIRTDPSRSHGTNNGKES